MLFLVPQQLFLTIALFKDLFVFYFKICLQSQIWVEKSEKEIKINPINNQSLHHGFLLQVAMSLISASLLYKQVNSLQLDVYPN